MPDITLEQVAIEYPAKDEKVVSPYYTFRIAASPEAEKVEISVDGSDWLQARFAVGYWWFDWSGYQPGPHQVAARVILDNGESHSSAPRHFKVDLDTEPQNGRRREKRR